MFINITDNISSDFRLFKCITILVFSCFRNILINTANRDEKPKWLHLKHHVENLETWGFEKKNRILRWIIHGICCTLNHKCTGDVVFLTFLQQNTKEKTQWLKTACYGMSLDISQALCYPPDVWGKAFSSQMIITAQPYDPEWCVSVMLSGASTHQKWYRDIKHES